MPKGKKKPVPLPIDPTQKYGTILPGTKNSPGGNESEFPEIRQQLRKRGVVWYERDIGNSTVFWFFGSQVCKLPEDPETLEDGKCLNYLPVNETSGHNIYPIESTLERHPGKDILYTNKKPSAKK